MWICPVKEVNNTTEHCRVCTIHYTANSTTTLKYYFVFCMCKFMVYHLIGDKRRLIFTHNCEEKKKRFYLALLSMHLLETGSWICFLEIVFYMPISEKPLLAIPFKKPCNCVFLKYSITWGSFWRVWSIWY